MFKKRNKKEKHSIDLIDTDTQVGNDVIAHQSAAVLAKNETISCRYHEEIEDILKEMQTPLINACLSKEPNVIHSTLIKSVDTSYQYSEKPCTFGDEYILSNEYDYLFEKEKINASEDSEDKNRILTWSCIRSHLLSKETALKCLYAGLNKKRDKCRYNITQLEDRIVALENQLNSCSQYFFLLRDSLHSFLIAFKEVLNYPFREEFSAYRAYMAQKFANEYACVNSEQRHSIAESYNFRRNQILRCYNKIQESAHHTILLNSLSKLIALLLVIDQLLENQSDAPTNWAEECLLLHIRLYLVSTNFWEERNLLYKFRGEIVSECLATHFLKKSKDLRIKKFERFLNKTISIAFIRYFKDIIIHEAVDPRTNVDIYQQIEELEASSFNNKCAFNASDYI